MVHLSTARFIRSRGPSRFWKRQFVFKQTTHFYGRRRNCYSIAVRALHKAWKHAFYGRRIKRRETRKLWITRTEAGLQEHGIKYNPFMANLVKYNIQLDRKMLSALAVTEPKTFKSLADLARIKYEEGMLAAVRANPDRILLKHQTTQDELLESVKKLRLADEKQTGSSQLR